MSKLPENEVVLDEIREKMRTTMKTVKDLGYEIENISATEFYD